MDEDLPHTGNWEAGNPEIWKIIEPSSRLAERLLMTKETLLYVRIYIFLILNTKLKQQQLYIFMGGSIKPMDQGLQKRKKEPFFTVHPHQNSQEGYIREELQRHISQLIEDIPTLNGFMYGNNNPMTNDINKQYNVHGADGVTNPLAHESPDGQLQLQRHNV